MIHEHSENIKIEILTKNTLVFVRRYSFVAILFLKTKFIDYRENGY